MGRTNTVKCHALLSDAIDAAVRAGEAILGIYQTDFEVEIKADNSPVTTADKKAHEIIKERLNLHNVPFISEEGKNIPYETRCKWPAFWIVDPLDGTKEFINKNGEFTVNIAMAEYQQVVMGVVYSPVMDWLYFASVGLGAYKLENAKQHVLLGAVRSKDEKWLAKLIYSADKLPLKQTDGRAYRIVGSRSHATTELDKFVKNKKDEIGKVEFVQAGSSLKICMVAEGTADIYPRLGPTMEWDTAAGQAIAECAGAGLYNYKDGTPLIYNKLNMLNPWFVVERKAS